MNTMKWLIRRELWEHKGMVLWAPTAVASMIAVMASGAVLMGRNVHFTGGDENVTFDVSLAGAPARKAFAAVAADMYMVTALPLLMMLGFLVFFYCLGALHDDRRDRSVLFWKSLPVSDLMTVLSKVVLALAVVPLVTMGVGIALSLVVVLLACAGIAAQGHNVFGAVLSSSEFYLAPLRLIGVLPVYMLWALPTVGWLLMVSSWARSKVFLWAVGVPLVSAMLIAWTSKIFALHWASGWYMENVVARLLVGVAPGSWFAFARIGPDQVLAEGAHHVSSGDLFIASWGSLASPALWVGVAAGVAMIAAAVWLRRWREEG
jgi:ABC-2 type transport system permease protein